MKLQHPKHSTFCRIIHEGKKRAAVIESVGDSYTLLRLMNSQTKIIVKTDELLSF